MPTGTRIERAEEATKKTLQLLADEAGKGNVAITVICGFTTTYICD